jgi:hypothetical protein
MEPLNDNELNEFLAQWEAPPAPTALKPPREPRPEWFDWLIRGSIRVPVPAGLLAIVILVVSVYWAVWARQAIDRPARTVTLSDFQPVKQLQPRIIRSDYEDR